MADFDFSFPAYTDGSARSAFSFNFRPKRAIARKPVIFYNFLGFFFCSTERWCVLYKCWVFDDSSRYWIRSDRSPWILICVWCIQSDSWRYREYNVLVKCDAFNWPFCLSNCFTEFSWINVGACECKSAYILYAFNVGFFSPKYSDSL